MKGVIFMKCNDSIKRKKYEEFRKYCKENPEEMALVASLVIRMGCLTRFVEEAKERQMKKNII